MMLFALVLMPMVWVMLYALPVHAAMAPIINEIAWMGTAASANDEWIELYNPSDSSVDLAGWKLVADDGTPSIALKGTIGSKEYFLLERTSNDTVKGVTADQIYTGGLDNSGEALSLENASGAVVDRLTAWYAGTDSPRASMIRIVAAKAGTDQTAWATSTKGSSATDAKGAVIIGSPRAENEIPVPAPTIAPAPVVAQAPQPPAKAKPVARPPAIAVPPASLARVSAPAEPQASQEQVIAPASAERSSTTGQRTRTIVLVVSVLIGASMLYYAVLARR